jgi:hypothetical protein
MVVAGCWFWSVIWKSPFSHPSNGERKSQKKIRRKTNEARFTVMKGQVAILQSIWFCRKLQEKEGESAVPGGSAVE